MRTHVAWLLAVAFAVSPLAGAAGEKQIADVKEIAGTWHGWVTLGSSLSRTTMVIKADGSYEASTQQGGVLTVGKYYLEGGKLRYRSSRSEGTATFSEENGKAFLTVIPEDANLSTGKTEYERGK